MDSQLKPARRYRGITATERRAQRRERLMEAGLELFGTAGYARTSVRTISAAASLNSRYFYESFQNREDLLYHVYERIVREMVIAAGEATAREHTVADKARAGLRAGFTLLAEDPRKARVVGSEVVGVSERIERARRQARNALAQLAAREAMSVGTREGGWRLDPVLTARSLIGAVVEVVDDWINGELEATLDELVEHFTTLFTVAAAAAAG